MNITDGTSTLYVFGIEGYSNLSSKPKVGDIVYLYGPLAMFKETAEIGAKNNRAELKGFTSNNGGNNQDDDNKTDVLTVKQAIDKADATNVKVKGVVCGSLCGNYYGYYIADATGCIIVTTDKNKPTCKIGDEVTVSGKKDRRTTKSTGDYGIVWITESSVTVNSSNNSIPQDAIESKTVSEMVTIMSSAKDNTAGLYKVTGKLAIDNAQYNTYKIENGSDMIKIFTGEAGGVQYDWAKNYLDKEVTIVFGIVNYNGKIKANVVYIIDGSNTIYNTYCF